MLVRTVEAMTRLPSSGSSSTPSGVAALADELYVARRPPGPLLLQALAVARVAAAAASTGPSACAGHGALLAGLHLDLAAGEIAHAAGLNPTDYGAGVSRGEAAVFAALEGRRLVEWVARVLQHRLRRGPGDAADRDGLDAEQLLACTRAVLYLDAARRAWPDQIRSGRVR